MAQSGSAFSNLAANSTGDLYINSSLVLRTSRPATAGNVFHYGAASGWNWFTPDWGPVNGMVDVSSAGDVMATTDVKTSLQCIASHCQSVTTETGRIAAPAYHLDSFAGRIQLSHNGRYALLTSGTTQTSLDLTTGLSRSFTGVLTAPKQAITDAGCALIHGSSELEISLRCPSGDNHFTAAEANNIAKINAAGTRIVYWHTSTAVASGTTFVLRAIDVPTGQGGLLAELSLPPYCSPASPCGSSPQVWISDDGRQIVYLASPSGVAPPQIFVIGGDGSGRRQLTTADSYPEGFLETTLAPDGSSAYAISLSNRVVQIGISTGQVSEIVPRTPIVSGYGWGSKGLVPGSMAVIWGTALSDATASATIPLPLSLAGASVKVGDRDAPVISAQANAVRFQVPFETPIVPTAIAVASASPFELNPSEFLSTYPIAAWDFSILDLSPDPSVWSGLSAIHQNFSSPITMENPAQPGEIVHLYVVGLGPVSPPVATGQPGPSNPPATVLNPPQCSNVVGSGAPVAIPFAGLAPGLIGIYQLSLQLPESSSLSPGQKTVVIDCRGPGGAFVLRLGFPIATP